MSDFEPTPRMRVDLLSWPKPVQAAVRRYLDHARSAAERHPEIPVARGHCLSCFAERRAGSEDALFSLRILWKIGFLRATALNRRRRHREAWQLRHHKDAVVFMLWTYGRRRIDCSELAEQAASSARKTEELREENLQGLKRRLTLARGKSGRRSALSEDAREMIADARKTAKRLREMRSESDPLRALAVYGRRVDPHLPLDAVWSPRLWA